MLFKKVDDEVSNSCHSASSWMFSVWLKIPTPDNNVQSRQRLKGFSQHPSVPRNKLALCRMAGMSGLLIARHDSSPIIRLGENLCISLRSDYVHVCDFCCRFSLMSWASKIVSVLVWINFVKYLVASNFFNIHYSCIMPGLIFARRLTVNLALHHSVCILCF